MGILGAVVFVLLRYTTVTYSTYLLLLTSPSTHLLTVPEGSTLLEPWWPGWPLSGHNHLFARQPNCLEACPKAV